MNWLFASTAFAFRQIQQYCKKCNSKYNVNIAMFVIRYFLMVIGTTQDVNFSPSWISKIVVLTLKFLNQESWYSSHPGTRASKVQDDEDVDVLWRPGCNNEDSPTSVVHWWSYFLYENFVKSNNLQFREILKPSKKLFFHIIIFKLLF